MTVTIALITLLPWLCVPTAAAQGPADGVKQAEKSGDKAKQNKKPELWPKLKPVRRSIAKDKISLLGSKDPDKVEVARRHLMKYGPGVCPVLLRSLTPRQKPAIAAQLRSLLDELTGPKYTEGLRAAYNPRNEAVSLYVIKRLRSFKDPKLKAFFEKAATHKNAEIADQAWFAAAEIGDAKALPYLFAQAQTKWKDRALEIVQVSPGLKSKASTDFLVDKLHAKDISTKLASLRLLWGMGTKDAVSSVANQLDSTEHVLRIGAVNALRGIVDDKPMYKNLSVFQAIGEVKKWKRRVGR